MNKNIKSLLAVLLVLMFAGSVSAYADTPTWTNVSAIHTGDTTPTVPFTVTGNNASYVCNLWIAGVPSGVVTAINGTETSITCNWTLPQATYTYNISAYNSTDPGSPHYSSDYSLRVSTFYGITELITDIIPAFDSLKDMVIAVAAILVIIAIVMGMVGMFGNLFTSISGFFKKKW